MKFLAPLLLVALLAGTAQADPLPPPAPPMQVQRFGGTILGVDVAVLCASYVNGYAFLAYPLAAPVVHLAHQDYGGAAGSFVLHLAGPILGFAIGYQLDKDCGGDFCVAGALLGGALGVIAASTIDAAFLAHVERPVPPFARNLPTPTLALAPGGGLLLGVAGRL